MEPKRLEFLMNDWNADVFRNIDSYLFKSEARVNHETKPSGNIIKEVLFKLNEEDEIGLIFHISKEHYNPEKLILTFDIFGFYRGLTTTAYDKIILSQHIKEISRIEIELIKIVLRIKENLRNSKKIRLYQMLNGEITYITENDLFLTIPYIKRCMNENDWNEEYLGLIENTKYKKRGKTSVI